MVKISWCLCLMALAVTAVTATSARLEVAPETTTEPVAGGGASHSHSAHSTSKGKVRKESESKSTVEDLIKDAKTRRRKNSRIQEALEGHEGHTADLALPLHSNAAEGAASLSPADNQEENFSVVADRTLSPAAEAERAPSPAADGALSPPAAEVADRARLPRAEREIGSDQASLRSHLPQSEPERNARSRSRYGSDRNRSRSEGSQRNRFETERYQRNRYGSERNRFRNEENQRNRFNTAQNRKSPSWSDRNRVTPEQGRRRSTSGGENTARLPTQTSRRSAAPRYAQGGDRRRPNSRPSTDTRRFIPAARPDEGPRQGRSASGPAWLAWYNTLPWRQEMLSQYGESQRPSRLSFGL